MGGVSATTSSVTSSFLAVDEDEHPLEDQSFSGRSNKDDSPLSSPGEIVSNVNRTDERPERVREKRSIVVDELASRIRSSALTT